MKKFFLIFLLPALLVGSINAAIVLDYDYYTGEYSISGSDSGSGFEIGSSRIYSWDFDDSQVGQVTSIFNALESELSGTTGGATITNFDVNSANAGSLRLRGYAVQPGDSAGPLVITSSSGTIATDLWTDGPDTIIGTAYSPYGTAESFTITVPEPSTYAMIAGALGLGLAIFRRKNRR